MIDNRPAIALWAYAIAVFLLGLAETCTASTEPNRTESTAWTAPPQ